MLPHEFIIVFNSTNIAIKAEQCLLEQGLQVGVMPLPSQISTGCGICLRVRSDDIPIALKALTKMQINDIGVYSRTENNGKYSYVEEILRGGNNLRCKS